MLKQVQKLIILLVFWVSLPLFLLTTDPETLPLPLLLVPFLLLALALYKTAELGYKILFKKLTTQRIRLLAVITASLPTLILILASIGQLTLRDTAIIGGLLIFLTFYLRRIDFIKT